MKPKTKARHIHKVLCEIAEEFEYSDLPILKETKVIWGSGPFEWAISALGGESIFCGELGNYSLKAEPKLQKVLKCDFNKDGVELQCENGYTIGVY